MLLASMLLGLALAAGWAAAQTWLPAAGRDALAVSVTTVALGVGLLTQIMLWMALLVPGRLGPGSALVTLLVVCAAAAPWWRRLPRPAGGPISRDGPGMAVEMRALAAAVLVLSTSILAGAALWPFGDGDALAVYGPLGRGIAATGRLPVGERLYEAYPMLVPMLYAALEWVAGRPSEYLARLATAILAVGGVAGAGWLARELRSPRAGWFAAALLVACPVYCRWATSGYADAPAGLFVVLVAIFAWRWWRGRGAADALLCGAAAGLALWTKNSVVTLVVSGAVLAVAWWWAERARHCRRGGGEDVAEVVRPWRWAHLAAACVVGLAIATPFYVRNLVLFGFVFPATVWSDRASHGLGTLLVVLRPAEGFGLLGWAAVAAVVVGLVVTVRRRGVAPAEALLLALVVPFVGAWWWWASYDPRFLVTMLAVAAGFAGPLLEEAVELLTRWLGGRRRLVTVAVVASLLLGMPVALRRAVEHKRALVAHPLMGDLERHRLQVGGLFELARAIDRLPAGTRVGGVPPTARYYLAHDRLPLVEWRSPDSPPCAGGPEYWVRSPASSGGVPDGDCPGRAMIRTADGYELVRGRAAPAADEEQGR